MVQDSKYWAILSSKHIVPLLKKMKVKWRKIWCKKVYEVNGKHDWHYRTTSGWQAWSMGFHRDRTWDMTQAPAKVQTETVRKSRRWWSSTGYYTDFKKLTFQCHHCLRFGHISGDVNKKVNRNSALIAVSIIRSSKSQRKGGAVCLGPYAKGKLCHKKRFINKTICLCPGKDSIDLKVQSDYCIHRPI